MSKGRRGSKKLPRCTGTVVTFNLSYGWINVDGEKGDAYVHWEDIQANGYKTLRRGQKVAFRLEHQEDGKMKALQVTQANGKRIENDKKLSVDQDGEHATGTVLQFFGNYGWITMDDGTGDAYVHWQEIAGDREDGYKALRKGEAVEFTVIRQDDDRLKAVGVSPIKSGGGGARGRGRGRRRGRGRGRGRGGRGRGRR